VVGQGRRGGFCGGRLILVTRGEPKDQAFPGLWRDCGPGFPDRFARPKGAEQILYLPRRHPVICPAGNTAARCSPYP